MPSGWRCSARIGARLGFAEEWTWPKIARSNTLAPVAPDLGSGVLRRQRREAKLALAYRDKGESMTNQSWFVFALIGGVCFGLHAVLTRITLTDEFTPMVVNTYFFTLGTVILWLYTAFARNVPVPDSRTALKLLLMAVVAVIGFWGVFKGYALAPNLGYVRAVFSVNVIVAYALSLRLFDMALSTRGVMGMILVIVGTVLISLG